MVCTHTLYNEVWAGNLSIAVTELPEATKRKQHKETRPRESKKSYGKCISVRPEIVSHRIEEGHWEGDTVVGKRAGKEAVILSLLEKKTENYLAIQIAGKTAAAVRAAMEELKAEYGERFPRSLRPLQWTTARSFPTSAPWSSGEQRSTLPTLTPHGSVLRMSDTTACSGLSCQRERPLRISPRSTSCLLLMS